MVGVFREVRRALRDDGTVWLNLGATYGEGGQLVAIPWLVALALQGDSWVLRSDMPWVKRSAMPESAENRPCKSLECVFMLTKGQDHYFDMDAVRPRATTPSGAGGACFGRVMDGEAATAARSANRRYERPDYTDRAFRNSDLWFASVDKPHGAVGIGDELVGLDVTARGYKGAHFAVFPPELITPLILASTSEYGCCEACGRPWERIVSKTEVGRRAPEGGSYAQTPELTGTDHQNVGTNSLRGGVRTLLRETVGWRQACGCRTDEVVPATVLDPFVGSGTTVATAIRLGRAGVGIDLSEAYLLENAIPRIEAATVSDRSQRGTTVAVPTEVPPSPRRLR
jgi:DNA modification methylase